MFPLLFATDPEATCPAFSYLFHPWGLGGEKSQTVPRIDFHFAFTLNFPPKREWSLICHVSSVPRLGMNIWTKHRKLPLGWKPEAAGMVFLVSLLCTPEHDISGPNRFWIIEKPSASFPGIQCRIGREYLTNEQINVGMFHEFGVIDTSFQPPFHCPALPCPLKLLQWD